MEQNKEKAVQAADAMKTRELVGGLIASIGIAMMLIFSDDTSEDGFAFVVAAQAAGLAMLIIGAWIGKMFNNKK